MTHPALATMVEAAEAGDVSREQAIQFLEGACRNWSKVPRLSEDDISDVATELTRFSSRRSATANILSIAQYVKGLEEALRGLLDANTAVQNVLCDGPEVPGFDPSELGRAQLQVTVAEDRAEAALSGGKP